LAIRKCRRDRDLSQDALADRAGINASYLGEIERGQRDPRWRTIGKIMTALDVRLSELANRAEGFTGDDDA